MAPKAKPSPSNTNKGIFANAKYSKLIQKKGVTGGELVCLILVTIYLIESIIST